MVLVSIDGLNVHRRSYCPETGIIAGFHIAEFHIAEFHIAGFHIAGFHIGEFHIAEFHLAESHLAESHLAVNSFAIKRWPFQQLALFWRFAYLQVLALVLLLLRQL
jgi:hypothetical protein